MFRNDLHSQREESNVGARSVLQFKGKQIKEKGKILTGVINLLLLHMHSFATILAMSSYMSHLQCTRILMRKVRRSKFTSVHFCLYACAACSVP